jgi:hypothetical protein
MSEVWTAFMFLAEADRQEGIPHGLISYQGLCPLDHAIEQARSEGASSATAVLLAEDETENFNPLRTYERLRNIQRRWRQVGFDLKIQTYSCLEAWLDHHVTAEGHWDIIHLSLARASSQENEGVSPFLECAVA